MNKILLIIVCIIAGALVYFLPRGESVIVRGIQDGQSYNSTTTYQWSGKPMPTGFSQLKSSGGTFGSLIIQGAVAGALTFWDATSTTDVSSTTLVIAPASMAAGTYIYDITFDRGLIVNTVASLIPTSTITWR